MTLVSRRRFTRRVRLAIRTIARRSGARCRRVGLHGRSVDRAAADERLHVRGRRRRGVPVGELELGQLGEGAAAVGRDVEPVVLVGLGVGEAVLLGLEALREVLARPGVQRGPRAPVVGALQRPCARVALGRVVGRGEGVVDDRDGLGEAEADPARSLARQPLLLTSPSLTFSAVSLGGFSALAVTSTTLSRMLPGMPGLVLPVTPCIFLLPWASVSAVLSQVGAGSEDSNDDEKSVAGACAIAVEAGRSESARCDNVVIR